MLAQDSCVEEGVEEVRGQGFTHTVVSVWSDWRIFGFLEQSDEVSIECLEARF